MALRIRIEGLELSAFVGVPEAERASAQRLTAHLFLELRADSLALRDVIDNTVDYFVVCEEVKTVTAARPRRLLETLADEIATHLLDRFHLRAVEIELRKYILPDTAFVAVQFRRER